MVTSLKWIKDYCPELSCSSKEYLDRMTLAGTKVESVRNLSENLRDIYIGRILSVSPHSNASKLVVCSVSVGAVKAEGVAGDGSVQIVTGAPNITADSVGAYVPVVLPGGKVAGGHEGGPLPEGGIDIGKGNLRGVESFGMMCSIEELGSDRFLYPDAPENGIYIFPGKVLEELGLSEGDSAIEALGLDDEIAEYEITSNRVDCYSVLGIAREASAVFDTPFRKPPVEESGAGDDIHDHLKVTVENPEFCPRYVARMVRNIRYAPSPEWMQSRLRNSGIRPINNLVDITNFVMLEYGQPMHAFDYDTLYGHEIIVKCAHEGDTFTTLDSQERVLGDEVLMINDAEKPVGIAGIMGGMNSMITDNVHTVVFESACFDGANIRRSSRKIGMRTDASAMYEKGLDPENSLEACNRACELVEELSCGEVLSGYIDIYPEPEKPVRVLFEPKAINERLGTDFSDELMLSLLGKLYIDYDADTHELIIPSFRRDLHESCDISEEVMRMYGYDRIGETLPTGEATLGGTSFKRRVEGILRDIAEFAGFSEIMTYNFESPKVFDLLHLDPSDTLRKTVAIANPLGEDYSVMRTTPLPGMLSAIRFNYNHRNKNIWLYELASIYLPHELPLAELPDEREELILGGYGDGMDFFFMKGMIEDIFAHLGMKERMTLSSDTERPYFHPGRKADIFYSGMKVGYLGEIHPETAESFGFKKDDRIYIAVLDIPAVLPFVSFERRHLAVVRYPAVERDLSMIVPQNITAGEIEDSVISDAGSLLESVSLFDIYEGDQVAKGFKSMAYRISLRAEDRTLVDDEIVQTMEKIVSGLKKLGVELRS